MHIYEGVHIKYKYIMKNIKKLSFYVVNAKRPFLRLILAFYLILRYPLTLRGQSYIKIISGMGIITYNVV